MLVAFSSVVYIVIAAAGTFAHKAQFKGYAGHHLDFVRLARRMNCRVKNYDMPRPVLLRSCYKSRI